MEAIDILRRGEGVEVLGRSKDKSVIRCRRKVMKIIVIGGGPGDMWLRSGQPS